MALELWRKRAEQESFGSNIFKDIDVFKEKLKRKIQSLHVAGNHHEANRKEETLARVEQVEKKMKQLSGET